MRKCLSTHITGRERKWLHEIKHTTKTTWMQPVTLMHWTSCILDRVQQVTALVSCWIIKNKFFLAVQPGPSLYRERAVSPVSKLSGQSQHCEQLLQPIRSNSVQSWSYVPVTGIDKLSVWQIIGLDILIILILLVSAYFYQQANYNIYVRTRVWENILKLLKVWIEYSVVCFFLSL